MNFQMFKLVIEKAEDLYDPPPRILEIKAKIDVFLEFSWVFNDPTDIGNLISDSSAFYKTNLNIWNFMVHILLKPGLENFKNYFTSM